MVTITLVDIKDIDPMSYPWLHINVTKDDYFKLKNNDKNIIKDIKFYVGLPNWEGKWKDYQYGYFKECLSLDFFKERWKNKKMCSYCGFEFFNEGIQDKNGHNFCNKKCHYYYELKNPTFNGSDFYFKFLIAIF